MKSLVRYALYGVFLLYLLGALFDVRGGYRSGDELGFLSGFADRGVDDSWFDPRYWFWIKYVSVLKAIGLSVPLINVIIFFTLIFKLVSSGILNRSVVLALPLMPTVFYFANSYLRDFLFFLCAIYFLLNPEIKFSTIKGKLSIFLCFILVMMRPIYGIMLVASLIVSSNNLRRYYFAFFWAAIFTLFCLVPILLMLNDYVFESYRNFFIHGHVRDKIKFTVFMIEENNFTNITSPIIFCFSFIKFWFVPVRGIGNIYDHLISIENLFFLIIFFYGLTRAVFCSYFSDRRYRMAMAMLIFSIVAAAGITTDNDIYRFRIFFVIFFFYFSCFVRSPNKRKNSGEISS